MIKELIKKSFDKKKNIHEQAKSFLDDKTKDGRILTDEESDQFDKMMEDFHNEDKNLKSLQKKEKLEALEKEHSLNEKFDEKGGNDAPTGGDISSFEEKGNEGMENFNFAKEAEKFSKLPHDEIFNEEKNPYSKAELQFARYLAEGVMPQVSFNLRALDDPKGGFLTLPPRMMAGILAVIDDETFIRRLAGTEMVDSGKLGILSREKDIGDPTWTQELKTGDEDDNLEFGGRMMEVSPIARRIKVSRELIMRSSRNIFDIVSERLGYKLAVVQENNFLVGNGVNKPLGVLVNNPAGITANRDVSAITNASGVITSADKLIDMKYTLKAAYWGSSRWMISRARHGDLAKLKDNDGRYLFRTSLTANEPDMLLGMPVDMSEFMPAGSATGDYIVLLASWMRGYKIVDGMNMEIQRLDELYAETNQVGYIMRSAHDAQPLLEEAFVRGKRA